jgi:hypothetical protein
LRAQGLRARNQWSVIRTPAKGGHWIAAILITDY